MTEMLGLAFHLFRVAIDDALVKLAEEQPDLRVDVFDEAAHLSEVRDGGGVFMHIYIYIYIYIFTLHPCVNACAYMYICVTYAFLNVSAESKP